MRRIAILVCLLFCINTFVFADGPDYGQSQNPNARYRLFPTQNMWTFLKLDTMTGKIWQVQYSTDDSVPRFEMDLNPKSLIIPALQPAVEGRFTLYPTQDKYAFILLDQINGATYQVQWNVDKKKRHLLPISK